MGSGITRREIHGSLRQSTSFAFVTFPDFLSSLLISTLAPVQPPSQPKSRWEEIRAEHARNLATRSSWDELRQNASKPKLDDAGNQLSQDPGAERLTEQQKFDDMLEAERQKATEVSRGGSWGV